MMARNIAIVVIGLALTIGLWSFMMNERPPGKDADHSQAVTLETNDILEANPILDMSSEIKQEDLQESLSCIDDTGSMTCGPYANQSALLYAVLGRQHGELDRLATRSMLRNHGNDALYSAAAIGDLKAIHILVRKGREFGFFDNLQDAFFNKADLASHPAVAAAEFGQIDVLEYLVDEGLDVNSITLDDGSDLFSRALIGKREQTVQFLVDTGYQIDCDYHFPNGRSYLDVSMSLGTADIDQLLHSRCSQQ